MSPSHLALPLPLRRIKRLPLALFVAGCATGSMACAAGWKQVRPRLSPVPRKVIVSKKMLKCA